MEEGLNTKIEGKGMKGRAWSRNGKKEEKKDGKEREREREAKVTGKAIFADKIRGTVNRGDFGQIFTIFIIIFIMMN